MTDVREFDPIGLVAFDAGSPVPAKVKRWPRKRKDGTCAYRKCGKSLPVVTAQVRKYAGPDMDREPFCSTQCAKAYFGTQATSTLKAGMTGGLVVAGGAPVETRVQRFRRLRSEELRVVLEREGSHGWPRDPGRMRSL